MRKHLHESLSSGFQGWPDTGWDTVESNWAFVDAAQKRRGAIFSRRLYPCHQSLKKIKKTRTPKHIPPEMAHSIKYHMFKGFQQERRVTASAVRTLILFEKGFGLLRAVSRQALTDGSRITLHLEPKIDPCCYPGSV